MWLKEEIIIATKIQFQFMEIKGVKEEQIYKSLNEEGLLKFLLYIKF